MIYDIEQGFLLRRKVNLFLNIGSNLACNARPCGGHSPVKVCLCSILQWAAKACYQDFSGFLYFLQHGCGSSYATFCFQLPQSSLLTLTQYAFLATALACFAQAFCGHRRAIMEAGRPVVGNHPDYHPGEASRGTPINDIATSLAVGIALSGVLTMLIGFSGLGHRGTVIYAVCDGLVYVDAGCATDHYLFKVCSGCRLA